MDNIYTCPHCRGKFTSNALDVLSMQGGKAVVMGPFTCPVCGRDIDVKELLKSNSVGAAAVGIGCLIVLIIVGVVIWMSWGA